MRGRRAALSASVFAIAALVLGVFFPATASATVSATASSAPADVATGVSAAVETELDRAVAGDPPSGLECVSTTGARACFEKQGDKWWVLDTAADSASADAVWQNYRNGSLHRQGICRNSLGNGKWGVCNKNYYEDSGVRWAACVYDASADVLIRCSGRHP